MTEQNNYADASEPVSVTNVVMAVDYSYEDKMGNIWICVGMENDQYVCQTGSGMLQRTGYFNSDGTSRMITIPNLVCQYNGTFEHTLHKEFITMTNVAELSVFNGGLMVTTPGGEQFDLLANNVHDIFKQLNPSITSDHKVYSHLAWEQLLERTISQIQDLSTLKGGEYAGDVDRLANFRRNAEDLGLTMEDIWRVYTAKHWDAIGQYIRDLRSGKDRPRLEGLAGRCDDIIVYMILFKAMLEEAGVK